MKFSSSTPNGDKGKSVASLATAGVENRRAPIPVERKARSSFPIRNSGASRNRSVTSSSPPSSRTAKLVDSYETPFGIRTIKFTADNGFLLNGKRVPLNGVCDHHDLGALGAAINTRALERQIEILKEMGCNAIRTSHNPPAPELLDLCDRLGMVVMDEVIRLLEERQEARTIITCCATTGTRRTGARNSAATAIIPASSSGASAMKSANKTRPAGLEIAAELTRIVHEEDPTRPDDRRLQRRPRRRSTASRSTWMSSATITNRPNMAGSTRPIRACRSSAARRRRASVRAANISSRSATTRASGQADFQMSSYDLYAPPWATPPDTEFKGQDEFPFVAGEFVWTGFDYLGEPTPYNGDMSNLLNFTDPAEKARMQKELEALGKIKVPSRSSYFGIIDLAGFKKDRFYLYQARWRPDLPMAHILPHWNWPDRVGQVTPVHVYTSGDSAELFLNGKSLGLKKKGQYEYRLRWDDVVYQPGELKVVAYKNGKKWATDVVKTTGPAAKLKLQADRNTIKADGQDLSFVTVTVADKDGLLVPRSNNHVHFDIDGPGEIVATDNGDATSFESFQSHERNAFNGLCLVIVRIESRRVRQNHAPCHVRRSGRRQDSHHDHSSTLTFLPSHQVVGAMTAWNSCHHKRRTVCRSPFVLQIGIRSVPVVLRFVGHLRPAR